MPTMPMWLNLIVLVASLVALAFGAESLVRGAVAIARRLGISSFFIGLTIVGFGTSTPELATGTMSAAQGHDDFALGNVVGSNTCNVALIMGLTALIMPIPVRLGAVRREVLIGIAVSLVPYAVLATGGQVSRVEGGLLLLGLLAYLLWSVVAGRRAGAEGAAEDLELVKELEHELGFDKAPWRTTTTGSLVLIGIGLLLLAGASYTLVGSAVAIARELGISELVIALTVVAFGTSAPELVTSLVAAVRKQADISVGNILGSNIFNILGILGASALVTPQVGARQVLVLDLPVMILAAAALLPIVSTQSRVSRVEGGLLLLGYIAYTLVLFLAVPAWFGGPQG